MSRRELEALKTDSQEVAQTRLRQEYRWSMELCDIRMRLGDADVLAQRAKIAEAEDVLVRMRKSWS